MIDPAPSPALRRAVAGDIPVGDYAFQFTPA